MCSIIPSRCVKTVARTRLMVSLLALGLLLSVAPLHSATPVDVRFTATDTNSDQPVTLQAQLHKPEGDGPFPAVVLMHGCGGLSPPARDALRAHAEYLVRSGYVVLNLDSFGPRGYADGWVCESFDRLMHARRYRSVDALDSLHYLGSLEFVDRDNIFQVGQSNGASVSIRLAQLEKREFRAVVAFYPWCGAFTRLGSQVALTSPLLVLGGALDDWTPPDACQSVEASGAEYRVVIYPEAVHSFDLEISRQDYKGHQVGHDQLATLDSRKQMLDFFDSHLTAERKALMPKR